MGRVFGIVAFVLLVIGFGCGRLVGQGTRNGNVVKLADEGFFWKTHEVEIIRGGLNAGQGGFGVKPFYATVSSPTDLAELQRAFEEQKEVIVTYDEYFWTPINSECAGEDEHCAYVTKVEVK